MSRLVSEVWLQRCQLSNHTLSVITFLTHHVYYQYVYTTIQKTRLERGCVQQPPFIYISFLTHISLDCRY